MRVASLSSYDIRFPTSRELDGSDAMNPDPDYSAAYVVLRADDGSEGHGFTFTIGRGNEVCRAAVDALAPLIIGGDLSDLGGLSRRLTHDSQLRWLGPEKGVMHLATAAVINAAWDLVATAARKPLWAFLSDMPPDELVDLVDWRYLTDALTPGAARDLLVDAAPGRASRAEHIREVGYPAYTTSAGWLGYPDEKIRHLAHQAVADGFRQIKLKVGADQADDVRRFALARAAVGPGIRIAVDANQRWDVPAAIGWMTALAPYDPWWIEEPTSPDDILGHAAIRRALAKSGPDGGPIRVATGEHVANRVVFKQLLQADAIDFVQLDACRVAGVNENIAILLLAAAYGKPVCPHAGGVGLCEAVQHLS
ncbi:enolase C-terminal domain-like protein, partial [Actinoplanes utahensis]